MVVYTIPSSCRCWGCRMQTWSGHRAAALRRDYVILTTAVPRLAPTTRPRLGPGMAARGANYPRTGPGPPRRRTPAVAPAPHRNESRRRRRPTAASHWSVSAEITSSWPISAHASDSEIIQILCLAELPELKLFNQQNVNFPVNIYKWSRAGVAIISAGGWWLSPMRGAKTWDRLSSWALG